MNPGLQGRSRALPRVPPTPQGKLTSLQAELADERACTHEEQAAELGERARKIPRVAASSSPLRAREALVPAQPPAGAALPVAAAAAAAGVPCGAAAARAASSVPRWRQQQPQQVGAAGGSPLTIPSDDELGKDISARFRARQQR